MPWIIIQYLSSIRPAPQKMILTIDTCTAAVYVSCFIPCYLSPTTLYRYLAGDLRNVALSFLGTTDTRALNLSSSDPKFKQLEKFLNNVQISIPTSNGRRTKTIRGLIERAGKFVFSKNDGQESTVAVCLLFISIWSFYPVAKYCKAPFPRNVQYPHPVFRHIWCQHLWQKEPASERYPCRVVWSHSGSTLQTKGSRVSYREGCRLCEDQTSRPV